LSVAAASLLLAFQGQFSKKSRAGLFFKNHLKEPLGKGAEGWHFIRFPSVDDISKGREVK
jgi:hypothetical protein